MSDSFMVAHGARRADAGFCVVPIASGQKWRGEYQNGRWWHLKSWEFRALTATPEAPIDIWSNSPGCGVGIATRGHSRVIGFDIHILVADVAGSVRRLFEQRLGTTPLVHVGRQPSARPCGTSRTRTCRGTIGSAC